MQVQFLVDFRGKLTRENYYVAGAVAEFDAGTAQALIDEGRAIAVHPAPAPDPAPAAPAKAPRKRQSGNDLAGGGVL